MNRSECLNPVLEVLEGGSVVLHLDEALQELLRHVFSQPHELDHPEYHRQLLNLRVLVDHFPCAQDLLHQAFSRNLAPQRLIANLPVVFLVVLGHNCLVLPDRGVCFLPQVAFHLHQPKVLEAARVGTILFVRADQGHHQVHPLQHLVSDRIGELSLVGEVLSHLLVNFEEKPEGVDLDDKESIVAVENPFGDGPF